MSRLNFGALLVAVVAIHSLISAVQRVAMPCSLGCDKFICGEKPCSACLPSVESGKLAMQICYNEPSYTLKCTKNRDCASWQMCTGRGLCIDVMPAALAPAPATATAPALDTRCKSLKRM